MLVPIVWCAVVGVGVGDDSARNILTCLLFSAVYGLPLAYLAEFLLGLPFWLVFRRFKVRSYVAFAGAGAVIGCLVILCMAFWTGTPDRSVLNPVSRIFPFYIIIGATGSAILFRAIVFSDMLTQ
jgi:hypothetical protein